MKTRILAILFIFIVFSLMADEIILNNGDIYSGTIICKKGEFLFIERDDECYQINQLEIGRVYKNGSVVTKSIFKISDFKEKEPYNIEVVVSRGEYNIQERKIDYRYPNGRMLPLSFLCFAITWDNLADIKDIKEVLDSLPSGSDTKKIKSIRTRKYIIAITSFIAGCYNTSYSFTRFEITADTNSLTLNYKF